MQLISLYPSSRRKTYLINLPMSEMVGLIDEVVSSDGDFRLYPRGTSMLPLIVEGKDSVVLVKPSLLSKYDIVLYRRNNGQYVLHRIIKINGDNLVLCGDNQTQLEKGITSDKVIAKVKGVYIGEKYYDGTTGEYKYYFLKLFLKRNFKKQWLRFKRVVKNPSVIWRKLKGE